MQNDERAEDQPKKSGVLALHKLFCDIEDIPAIALDKEELIRLGIRVEPLPTTVYNKG